MLCFFCALFCILCTIPFLYPILISCAYSVFVLNLGAVCLFFFCVSYEELSTHPCPPFSLFVFHFRFRLFTFQPPLQRASLAKAVWKLFASLEKGGGPRQGKPEGFHRNLRNLKRTCVTFNPLFASLEKGGGLPKATRRDFLKKDYKKVHYFLIPQSTHFVRSQLPLQGSLNNPSVICAIASLEKGGGLPKASRRDFVELYGI